VKPLPHEPARAASDDFKAMTAAVIGQTENLILGKA